MKTTFMLAVGLLTLTGANAETLQSAKVTTKVNDVRLYQPQKSGRQAKVGDSISGHTSVQTGRRSRTELTFQDKTITRLGANSTFSFRRGSRDINLNQGSILLQVPKSAGGATIRTATVTAAITGTTLMMEYNVGKWVKLITLEGTVALKLGDRGSKGGIFRGPRKIKVPAGKMIIMRPNGEIITKPVDVDLKRLLATSLLAGNKTFGPLSDEARRHIADAVAAQEQLKRQGVLVSQNQVDRHPGTRTTKHRNTTRDINEHNQRRNDQGDPGSQDPPGDPTVPPGDPTVPPGDPTNPPGDPTNPPGGPTVPPGGQQGQ